MTGIRRIFQGFGGRCIGSDRSGAMAVEVALAAPILAMMMLGVFEIGIIVARQHELQSTSSEIETIIVATNLGAETNPDELKQILMDSADLGEEDIAIAKKYRCGIASALVGSIDQCTE